MVDQLYNREFTGPRVIAGLRRYLRDKQVPTEIIAMSKSADIERIRSALRAGASEYIVKARMLSLPAVLARASRGSSNSDPRAHKNMRRLHDLSNETIGLLRTLQLPRFDSKGLGEVKAETQERFHR